MKENIFGEGLDIPMLGIRMTCQELWPDKTLDLFKDPVFQGPVLINFLQSEFMNVPNKLEYFFLAIFPA